MIKKYIKKPVVIEAFQLGIDCIPDWFMDRVRSNDIVLKNDKMPKNCHIEQRGDYVEFMYCEIKTLEGIMRGNYGDYIIKGIKGEIYPCKPDIFKKHTRKWKNETSNITINTT